MREGGRFVIGGTKPDHIVFVRNSLTESGNEASHLYRLPVVILFSFFRFAQVVTREKALATNVINAMGWNHCVSQCALHQLAILREAHHHLG